MGPNVELIKKLILFWKGCSITCNSQEPKLLAMIKTENHNSIFSHHKKQNETTRSIYLISLRARICSIEQTHR